MGQKVCIDPLLWIYAAICVFVIPFWWLISIVTAAIIHEFFHLCAVQITGGQVHNIHIKPTGAVIHAGIMPIWKTIFCTAAGPLGSACLLLTAKYTPTLAICGGIQCLFNLLPFCPLDGGKILNCIIELLSMKRMKR